MVIWSICLSQLEQDLDQKDFNTWIRPLQALEEDDVLKLFAPSQQWIKKIQEKSYHDKIEQLVKEFSDGRLQAVSLLVGNSEDYRLRNEKQNNSELKEPKDSSLAQVSLSTKGSRLDTSFTFDTFVAGKSNQLAFTACKEVAANLGEKDSNPLYIYGPTGLGKTHLMHSIANEVLRANPAAKVHYLSSERFVDSFVKALQQPGKIDEFKNFFRSLDVLLIDDVQFIAGKEGTQEEFFNIFNALLENSGQVVLTSDKFPKEINKLDDRLKSRCASGLTLMVDPPDIETRIAILNKMAEQLNIQLSSQAASYIAECVLGNVRELKGAFNKVKAMAGFRKLPIDLNLAKEALRDLVAVRTRQISIENIKKVVAEYFRISVRDLTGKNRSRVYARPRQIAMSLARELTLKSYPDIGQEFDGRDHTTVIHACRQIDVLKESEPSVAEDYTNLLRTLQA